MASGSVKAFKTQHDTYTHANGAVVNCCRSGNVVTVDVNYIGAADPIPAGQSLYIDVNMDSKYRPSIAVSAAGKVSGNIDYYSLTIYKINTNGAIEGYSYHGIDSGSFSITYVV